MNKLIDIIENKYATNKFDYIPAHYISKFDPRPNVLAFGWYIHPNTNNTLLCGLNLNKMNDTEIIIVRSLLKDAFEYNNAKDIYNRIRSSYENILSVYPLWLDKIIKANGIKPRNIFLPYQHGGAYATWRENQIIGSITNGLIEFYDIEEYIDKTPESKDYPDIKEISDNKKQEQDTSNMPSDDVSKYMKDPSWADVGDSHEDIHNDDVELPNPAGASVAPAVKREEPQPRSAPVVLKQNQDIPSPHRKRPTPASKEAPKTGIKNIIKHSLKKND